MERQRIGGISQLRMCTSAALHADSHNKEGAPTCLTTSWLLVLNENNEVKLWQHKGAAADMAIEQEEVEVDVEVILDTLDMKTNTPARLTSDQIRANFIDATQHTHKEEKSKTKASKSIGGVKRKLMKASSFFLKK